MKKKLIGFLVGALLSGNLLAAGIYDGIWQVAGETYVSVHQNGNQILVVGLWDDMDGWDASIGTINGNQVIINTILEPDGDKENSTVQFYSPTSGQVVVNYCSNCDLPIGQVLPIKKIF